MTRTLGAFTLLLAFAAAAAAVPITYVAQLDGTSENPPVPSAGMGAATAIHDDTEQTLSVDVTFGGLTGETTIAHIHCCVAPPGNVGVATPVPSFPGFPAGVMSGAYMEAFDLTLASSWNPSFITASGGTPADAEAALAAGLASGEAYFNIHTRFAEGGEIRGFFAVPEPSTALLLGAGLSLLALCRPRSA